MCGICGVVSLDGTTVPAAAELAAMNAALRHRGPDSAGSIIDGPVGLAMRRLSIIDLAGGDQPIANEDASVHVVCNGEIYNYRELGAELTARGHRLRTRSDTEVLVHLYEDEGPDFVRRLRGMFALAVWDSGRRRLVLGRDRFGIKPLYYSTAGGVLAFASELKALLARPSFSREIDLAAVDAYLAFNWVPSPMTVFRDARKLPAGHTLVWDGAEPVVRRYARPAPAPAAELRTGGAEGLAAELRDVLRESVRAHLVADVPVGVLLSGGIDSCTLAALAAEESSERLSTFSIGFQERAFSELDLARLVARRYGTDHHELVVRPDAVALLPRLAESFDEPFADSSALPTFLVSELAAQHVKVCFSGEGGDELFGGYNTYQADLLAPRIGRFAAAASPLVERAPSGVGGRAADRVKRFAREAGRPALERHLAWSEVFSADARAELLSRRDPAPADPLGGARARYAETAGAEALARLQDVDVGTSLVDDLLVKTDRASMAHSLETRVPFLDASVAGFAHALPAHLRVTARHKKRLLRLAAAPLLPAEILGARKRGFSIPAAAWLRGELQPFAREVLSQDNVRAQGFFAPAAVTALIDVHASGREDLSRQLWGLLTFTLWHDRWVGR